MFKPDLKPPRKLKTPFGKKLSTKAKKAINGKSVPELVGELDEWFSLYIRLRDCDKNGMVKCFTSGAFMHYRKAQAGHFVSRRHYATRWDEKNVQVQSYAENIHNQGNAPVFAIRLNEKYGAGTAEEIVRRKNNKFKLETFILKFLINDYKTRVYNLRVEKNL